MRISLWLILVVFFPVALVRDLILPQLIVWNVGQGQWLTYINDQDCLHFDMGGEKAPLSQIQQLCKNRKNILYLSHWDMDHVNFISRFEKRVPELCLAGRPSIAKNSRRKTNGAWLPNCAELSNEVQEIYSGSRKTFGVSANALSRVFLLKPLRILIAGDSTKSEELQWRHHLPKAIHGLILGHHGSKTSTGDDLLMSMQDLRWGAVSARKRKYGHPHSEVTARLKKHHVSVLKTEDWGNLRFLR